MKRILFVDDEPRLLDALRRMLRPQRHVWEMAFANSGAEALEILGRAPFDVVVSDMRMPAMDGAELLHQVQQRFPTVIRIVLSGYFEREAALRAVPVAHQFLAKPCDPDQLREAVERSCNFSSLLPDAAARRIVGEIGELPCLPRTCTALMAALRTPDIPLHQIGDIIEQDVGITAKVLQLVNSAFFGLLREVSSVKMAVNYLGLDTLKHLVLTAEIFRTFRVTRPIPGFTLESLQLHSQLAAAIAAHMPAAPEIVSSSVVAAVLHDIGKLVLASRLPDRFQHIMEVAVQQERPLYQVEHELEAVGHAEVGAYLLGLWGLPDAIVNAVFRHHRPEPEGAQQGLSVLAITHIADALALEVCPSASGDAPAGYSILNREYLETIGVWQNIAEWRSMARQMETGRVGN